MIQILAEQLEKQIDLELTKLIELEEQRDKYRYLAEEQDETVYRLRQALDAIQGKLDFKPQTAQDAEVRVEALGIVEVEPSKIPPSHVGPRGRPEPVDSRPLCNACGGRMEPSSRTLQSGKTIPMLMCMDSSCNNETYG